MIKVALATAFLGPRDSSAFGPPRSSLSGSASSGIRHREDSCIFPSTGCPTKAFEHDHFHPPRRRRAAFPPLFASSPSEAILDSDAPDHGHGDGAQEQARELRERARALRREATAAERTLRRAVQQRVEGEKKEADQWIEVLRGSMAATELAGGEEGASIHDDVETVPAAQTLAQRIRENRLGVQKLQKIVERLHERETVMMTGPEGYLSKEETLLDGGEGGGGGFVLGDYENNSLEYKREETLTLTGLLDQVLEAAQILDTDGGNHNNSSNNDVGEQPENGTSKKLAPKLKLRVSDLRQNRDALLKRRVDNIVGSAPGSKKDALGDYMRTSIEGDDGDRTTDRSKAEKEMKRMIERPPWLPLSHAAFASASPVEVPVSCWKAIKTDVLAESGFLCTSWDSTDVAAIFRGRLPRARTAREAGGDAEPPQAATFATVFGDLQARVADHPELKERVRLFLVYDYEWRPANSDEMREGPPPAILALAREAGPEQEAERGLGTKSLAALSTLLTLLTTFGYSLSAFGLNPAFFRTVVTENNAAAAVPACLPVFVGVLAVAALHEAAHLAAARRHRVRLGLPTPLPSFQLGTFGAVTPLRSFPPTRTALFDVALSGPGAALAASLLLLGAGLALTLRAPSLAAFPVVPAAVFKSSALVGSLVGAVAPRLLMAPLAQPVPVHPLFLVGFSGLLASAVNLLPIGRLDGGRACLAAWGRRAASLASLVSLILLAFCIFTGTSGTIAFWGAIVVTTQRLLEIPTVDEVTGVGEVRVNSYIALSVLALLALMPFPGGVGPI